MAATAEAGAPARAGGNVAVIAGASVGTVFEWYDFYLYGSLAGFITTHFFSGVNETTGYIFALLAFAAGFAVRPSATIRLNTGLSSSFSRIHRETPRSRIETRKGMRQAQALNTSSPSIVRTARMTIRLRKRPSVAVVWIQLV
jgi:hypothetical protein